MCVVVKVWDEGAGLSDDESSKVFERFYRGRASRSDGAGINPVHPTGMGLGLTICEGIIRAHGGRIWAEPNTPRGVAFLFSLSIDHPQPTLPIEEELAGSRDRVTPSASTAVGQIGAPSP
jgi:two-component system sensor histidine kinase KdpD